MKLETGRVPGQAQEFDQPTCLALEIRDHPFVVDLEHRQRQVLAPMRHHACVAGIGGDEVGLVMGIGVLAGEFVGVDREAGRHRVTATVDDPGAAERRRDDAQEDLRDQIRREREGVVLCFVGPPGTGKTSIGRSIANALGREFVRISLGGVRDEAEIRGHRRTYIGALPGRIIQAMKRAGTRNPLFMLDEIDKLGNDFRGDPSAALLEVLDPEQNYSFADHYLDLDYDLSQILFITTANYLDTIPPALQDRMEIIEFSGYLEEEKLEICRQFLVNQQLEAHGLDGLDLEFTDEGLQTVIREYTQEAGVRNLEREVANVCRKIARDVAEERPYPTQIDGKTVEDLLGPPRFSQEMLQDEDQVGIATGAAWTAAGGDILFIEVNLMPGKGNLTLTGQLGDVMQESARAALTYTRSQAEALGIDSERFEKTDIHIHLPEGAVPKDGPSAGVTITSALISAFTKRPIYRDVSMTGEITLRGRVLPVGGIREKALAARRAGIKKFILPKKNERDLENIPERLRQDLEFVLVEKVSEVIAEVMHPAKPALPKRPSRQAPLPKIPPAGTSPS